MLSYIPFSFSCYNTPSYNVSKLTISKSPTFAKTKKETKIRCSHIIQLQVEKQKLFKNLYTFRLKSIFFSVYNIFQNKVIISNQKNAREIKFIFKTGF